MQKAEVLSEIKLSGSHRVIFTWHPCTHALYLELQGATTKKDGHGFCWLDGATLQGAELQAFVEAIMALQWPQFEPAA